MAPDHICPTGLAIPFPAISGAEPCSGSNNDGYLFVGLIFPEGAMPIKYHHISLKPRLHQTIQELKQILQLIYQYEIDQFQFQDSFS